MSQVRGPEVISLWGAANAVLLGILIGYGEGTLPIALYAGSVLLIELIGVGFWLAYLSAVPLAGARAPRDTRAALHVGLIAAFIGLGFVYKAWLALPAAFPALALLADAVGWMWQRHETFMPRPTTDTRDQQPPPSSAPELVTAATVGGLIVALVRQVGRRRSR